MRLTLKYSLPFITVTLAYRQAEIEVLRVLVDTGSARTMFAADVVASGVDSRAGGHIADCARRWRGGSGFHASG